MRRGWAIVAAILVVLVVVGIAVGAYNIGLDEGVRRGADAGQVVEVVGRGYWHGGFFPFGLILFPLLVVGIFWLFGAASRGPRGGWNHEHGPGRFGPWSDEGRARFEERFLEWHRRQHEQSSSGTESSGG
jgi:hypothetical protein